MKSFTIVAVICVLLAPTQALTEPGPTQSNVLVEDTSKAEPSEDRVEFSKLSADVWMHTSSHPNVSG